MKKKKFILYYLLLTALLTGCKNENETEEVTTANRDIFAMDTYMSLTATGEKSEEALDAAVAEIQRLDDLLSVGHSDSEISIVNENGSEIISEDTSALIERSLELYESTAGAFDITVYPLMEEWGFISQEYKVPEENRLNEMLKYVNSSLIEYDKEEMFLSMPEGVQIDLGGIAKGYTSNRVMEIFKEYDIMSGMVSLGGNVEVFGEKNDGSLWKIAIQNPDSSSDYIGILQIKDKAVITSGGYERYFEQDGKVWHHILNPKTGYPAESGLTSVTIVSEDGTMADGLSTSLFVMGKDAALSYWREHSEDFDVILMEENGDITITEGLESVFSSEWEYSIEKK